MIHMNTNNLHYSVKGALEVCEDQASWKSNKKLIRKVVEEREPNPGKMIYLDLISQKKPSY